MADHGCRTILDMLEMVAAGKNAVYVVHDLTYARMCCALLTETLRMKETPVIVTGDRRLIVGQPSEAFSILFIDRRGADQLPSRNRTFYYDQVWRRVQ